MRVLLIWTISGFFIISIAVGSGTIFGQVPDKPRVLAAPSQDSGSPYTRSAKATALLKLKNHVAVFAGSRLAYIKGYRVRLTDDELLHGTEAILRNGHVYAPVSFAGCLTIKDVRHDTAPPYLASRWLYKIDRPEVKIPSTVHTTTTGGKLFFAVGEYATALGLKVFEDGRGLVVVGGSDFSFSSSNEPLHDAVITLFDTPEKFADPSIAIKYIPRLADQGPWTDHVRTTPELLKVLDGPEAVWTETPRADYDLTGFNSKLLGSKVPAPGVYPRLLFSPEDLPMLQNRIKQNKLMQMSMVETEELFKKSWWNQKTEDGQAFQQLIAGENAKPKGNIYNSHVNYTTNCLTSMALYSLLADDDEHGKQAAKALVTYYKFLEPELDKFLATSDSEFGTSANGANNGETQWRGIHGLISHMDLAFALDFGGKWMDADQKDFMRRIIAKATYGRRTNGGDGPRRAWRDINHVTWHLTHLISLAAIEGLEGFDAEAYASGAELTRDFLEWGIDKNGQIFETNGKNGGGMHFEILSMIILARRGDNLWGHPHWRKLLTAQVYTTSPDGKVVNTGGTWGGGPFAFDAIDMIKAFYPSEKTADYLLGQQYKGPNLKDLDINAYREKLKRDTNRVRLPGLTYPSLTRTVLYDTDWENVSRADLKLPNDWNDDVHGMFSTSSDQSTDATWLSMNVRQNHYIGSGHHHADEGMFYFSGLGVNWITESPFPKNYEGRYHNEVLIDGISEANGPPAKAKYLGAVTNRNAAIAAADLTYAYSWRWNTQVEYWDTNNFTKAQEDSKTVWEIEPDPAIIDYFRGTQRYKMRVWWPSYNFANWLPTLRAPWNPVQYVFRSTGLIRGDHPYSVVVDDVKKDEKTRLYQWTAMLGAGVWDASYPGRAKNEVVLSRAEIAAKPTTVHKLLPLKNGDPMLLIVSLDPAETSDKLRSAIKVETLTDGPSDSNGGIYDRVSIDLRSEQSNFKVLLIPFRYGDALPEISFDPVRSKARIKWNNQVDDLLFKSGADKRTRVAIDRGGKKLLEMN